MAFPILGTPRPQFSDSTGVLAAGTVQVLDPATGNDATYYPTADDADAGTNPQTGDITLNANGITPDGFFGANGASFKIVVQDSDGNTIWTEDDIHVPSLQISSSTPATGEVMYFDGDEWVNTDAVEIDPSGAVTAKHNGTAELRTAQHDATDKLSGAEVKDYGGTFRPLGFLDLERIDVTASRDVANDDWGKLLRVLTTPSTLTLIDDADSPNNVMLTVVALNVAVTIAEGAGVAIRLLDGSTSGGAAGDVTMAAGSVATIFKLFDSAYYVWSPTGGVSS